jgi:DNA-binding NarL/FixJ family response regulator
VTESTQPLTVMIVDDHTLLVDSLSTVLSMQGVSTVRPELSSAAAVHEGARATSPDLVLLDLDLGGAIGAGEDLIDQLTADGHRVVVVSGSRDAARLGSCLARGAHGVLSKALPVAALVDHVMTAARGEPVMAESQRLQLIAAHRSSVSRERDRKALFNLLSEREKAVLGALVEGDSVGRIAASAVVSEATVRTQVRSILAKLGVNTQLEAVAIAGRHGWFR